MQAKKRRKRQTQLERFERIMWRDYPEGDLDKLAEKVGVTRNRLKQIAHQLGVKRTNQPFRNIEIEENENLLYLEATVPEPTDFAAGSHLKIEVLAKRMQNQEELFHEDDRVDYEEL